MHKELIEKAKCLKTEMDNKGIDNLTKDDLEEAYYYSKILKNLMCIEKDGQIVEAMEESKDNDEIMKRVEMYEDYPERRYYDHYRYADSRFAPKGKGTYRRGYDEMYPDMVRHDDEWDRDMDRNHGRMYFTEPMSRYDNAKRGYEETKKMHRGNSADDKQMKMRELEKYAKELTSDVVEMVADMSEEEKNLLRTKMQTLIQKIQ